MVFSFSFFFARLLFLRVVRNAFGSIDAVGKESVHRQIKFFDVDHRTNSDFQHPFFGTLTAIFRQDFSLNRAGNFDSVCCTETKCFDREWPQNRAKQVNLSTYLEPAFF